jgi:D-amino-acid oxidase
MKSFERPASRREFIRFGSATAAFVAAPAIWRRAEADPCVMGCQPGPGPSPAPEKILPSPNFDASIVDYIAGVRPHRSHAYRLERVSHSGKHIVHNYGHGGAGITMSWGCATKVVELVNEILRDDAHAADGGIAILGAGVMGLTSATLLRQITPPRKIAVYTDKLYPETTSRKAGGQWCPASVEYTNKDDEFKQILRDSHAMFSGQIGSVYGVSPKDNYALERPYDLTNFRILPELTPETCYSRLPFAKMNCSGFSYRTLLVEPPIFLKKIHNDLVRAGIPFRIKKFQPETPTARAGNTVMGLSEKIIINCTGLGSKDLFGDPGMIPVKGQLLLLRPQPALDYLFSGYDGKRTGEDCHDWVQYVFPRHDALVVGGTYQETVNNEAAHPETCKTLAKHLKAIFSGTPPSCAGYPDHGL